MHGGLIRRLIVGSGLLALIIGAAFGALLIAIDDWNGAKQQSAGAREVLVTTTQVEHLVCGIETGQRDFLNTGNPEYLKVWTAAQATFAKTSARLQRLADTPEEENWTRRITQASQSYTHDYASPVVAAAQRGDPSARNAATMQEGNRRIAELRANIDGLVATERDVTAKFDERSRELAGRAIIAGAAGVAASILVSVLVVGYLSRVVVRPVRRTTAMADHVAGGDLGTRMPETGVGEIGQLARSFNAMGGSIEHVVDELNQLLEAQSALRRIAMLVARGASQTEVLDAIAGELKRLIDTDGGHILRYEPDNTATVVAATGAPNLQMLVGSSLSLDGLSITAQVFNTGRVARIDSYAEAPGSIAAHLRERGADSAVGAPIYIEGRLWGVVIATRTRGEPLPPTAEARLADYTDLIATTVANAQARADLAASRARLVVAADQTRRRIERDLHDGIQQQLVSLALALRTAADGMPVELAEQRAKLSAITDALKGAIDNLREISHGIHPPILSAGGLRPALNTLARRSAVPVDMNLHLDARLPEPIEIAAYYIVAEALANAAKHARASLVGVDATLHDGWLHLSIKDDGVGGADPGCGSGLVGLTDRVEALGGAITITSPAGHGTSLQVELPLDL